MPHGTPDWGLVGPKNITYGLDDMGELAVRLGSPHLWDRRGDALYCTDFRDGLGMCNWGAFGAGGIVNLVTGHSRQGAFAVNLIAGSTAGRYAWLKLAFPFQAPSYVGFEFSFSLDAFISEVRSQIEWYDGARHHIARARYNNITFAVEYWDSANVWQVVDVAAYRHVCTWPEHTMKLVVDMAGSQYVRLLLDERIYDLSAFEVGSHAEIAPPYWSFTIWNYGTALHNPDCYVDNVIVTQNEP